MVVVKGHEEMIVIQYRCEKEAWGQITWITGSGWRWHGDGDDANATINPVDNGAWKTG